MPFQPAVSFLFGCFRAREKTCHMALHLTTNHLPANPLTPFSPTQVSLMSPPLPLLFRLRTRVYSRCFIPMTTPPRPPPHPARRRLHPDPEALRQPYQHLSATFTFGPLLRYAPLHIITVTLPVNGHSTPTTSLRL